MDTESLLLREGKKIINGALQLSHSIWNSQPLHLKHLQNPQVIIYSILSNLCSENDKNFNAWEDEHLCNYNSITTRIVRSFPKIITQVTV